MSASPSVHGGDGGAGTAAGSRLELRVGAGGVTADLRGGEGRPRRAVVALDAATGTDPGLPPETLWRAALTAATEVLRDQPAPTVVRVADDAGWALVWDGETLGAARLAVLPAAPAGPGEVWAGVQREEPHVWAHVTSGRDVVGTAETYLVSRMTRGTWHVTDTVHADRWAGHDLPTDAAPDVLAPGRAVGPTDPTCFLGLDVPVSVGTPPPDGG